MSRIVNEMLAAHFKIDLREGLNDLGLRFSNIEEERKLKDTEGNFFLELVTDDDFRGMSPADQLEFHVQYDLAKGRASSREEAYQIEDPTGERREAAGIVVTTEVMR